MFCRKCGKEISSDVAFCRYCGANNPYYIADQAENQHTRYCRKCGKELAFDSEFCSYCGTKIVIQNNPESLSSKEDKANNTTKTVSRKKTWIWVLSATIALVAGLIIYGLTSNNRSNYQSTYSNKHATATPKWLQIWLCIDAVNDICNDGFLVTYGQELPSVKAPTKRGYVFQGYYSSPNGVGTQYYDSNMNCVHAWDQTKGGTIYAYWEKEKEKQYSSSLAIGTAVYVDIMSVEPCIGIYQTFGSNQLITPTYVICKCKTASGQTVYIDISVSMYHDEIDSRVSGFELKVGQFETLQYHSKRRFHGYVRDAETTSDGLSKTTGPKVIDIYQIDSF